MAGSDSGLCSSIESIALVISEDEVDDDSDNDDEDTLSIPKSLPKAPRRLSLVRSFSCSTSSSDQLTHIDAGSIIQEDQEDVNAFTGGSAITSRKSSLSDDDKESKLTSRHFHHFDGDSGLESSPCLTENEEDGDDDDDGKKTQVESAKCFSSDCHCQRLSKWLAAQADKTRSILNDDFYHQHRERLWPLDGPIEDHAQCNYDPYPTLAAESFRFAGPRDRLGRPAGRGTAYFPNGRIFTGSFARGGRRTGDGELFEREGGRILAGRYQDDRLHGICQIATNEGGAMDMVFDRGVAHGPARRFSPDGALQWTGRYRFGVPIGICWRSNDAVGWYAGTCNRSGRMTGQDVIYLYPDLHFALVGEWRNDCMRHAVLAQVTSLEIRDGMPFPIVEPVASSSDVFRMDVSGYSIISSEPLLRDPYEANLVEVRPSNMPEGGEGLFARKELPAGTVVSFYNGIRFHDCHVSVTNVAFRHSTHYHELYMHCFNVEAS